MFEADREMNARGLDFRKVLFLAHFQDVTSTGNCRNLNDMNTHTPKKNESEQMSSNELNKCFWNYCLFRHVGDLVKNRLRLPAAD